MICLHILIYQNNICLSPNITFINFSMYLTRVDTTLLFHEFVHLTMNLEFIEQIQILMQAQQVKHAENIFGKSNYLWLSNKKITFLWMSTKDEFLIRQGLNRLTQNQQISVMKKLLTWLDKNPNVATVKIPEMCIQILDQMQTHNLVRNTTITRINSFRSSLRRLSIFSNKITPILTESQMKSKSVTFNDVPLIYSISK